MALEMKKNCLRCETLLKNHLYAYICVHECTFCPDCTKELKNICPNCGGELVRRPRRPERKIV
ncbi:DUF1272 domain-containing protein [Alkalicoccobacillus porphyridii]|uniref:DUF1272 domain-containing protein n=1 Tax=Alkalicoccobacillus porphyridii TaxID=2597270 RepID=A0A553ZX67_9BACI|nr:DUF1272 domain-containing protein [Alkalicoccobacillus porphyridii]TSB46041.1 DUF1272 domain-containing protein [Alkalicoccobacillus porphyridii]